MKNKVVSDIDSKALRQPNETPKAYRIRLYKNKELYGFSEKKQQIRSFLYPLCV